MTKVDYIVVGCGLAGIAFCEELRKSNKSFLVFDDASQQSSKVAGGLFNPVVLKRFTAAWKAQVFLDSALPFYYQLQNRLNLDCIHEVPIFRIFNSIEEQNNWFIASDKPVLSKFLTPKVIQPENPQINTEFGLGRVLKTGWIDTSALIESYMSDLRSLNKFRKESFDYDSMVVNEHYIQYKGIQASHVVFSEGFGLKQNKYFNTLPLVGSKGEYITIQAPELKLGFILKGPVFIIPLGNQTFLVGATYDNDDKSKDPSQGKRLELLSKLNTMVNCAYEVVDQIAAIRPTVKDRRPLVGRHPNYNNLFVFNGLGTRGVLASPFLAKQLFDHIENNAVLESEIDIERYENLFIG